MVKKKHEGQCVSSNWEERGKGEQRTAATIAIPSIHGSYTLHRLLIHDRETHTDTPPVNVQCSTIAAAAATAAVQQCAIEHAIAHNHTQSSSLFFSSSFLARASTLLAHFFLAFSPA